MNKQRRKDIRNVCAKLEAIQDEIRLIAIEEQTAFSKMAETCQQNPQGQVMLYAVENLTSAVKQIENALGYLDEASI